MWIEYSMECMSGRDEQNNRKFICKDVLVSLESCRMTPARRVVGVRAKQVAESA